MNTASIFVKTDPKIKEEAQKTAEDLGFSLSSIINAFLRQFVKTKTINFSARDEIPNEYFKNAIKKAREDRRKGNVSPIFDNPDDAIAWLHK
jgi:addiction module RelB/DinJ family antitoxin